MAVGSRTKSRLSKAEQSRQTRRRIVEAATTLFLRESFQSTTVAAIAAEAGVAVQTLYLSFRNKTAILAAAFDEAVVGDDGDPAVMDRDWLPRVHAEPDGPTALRDFLEQCSVFIRRAAPLYAVIQAAASDPEVCDILTTIRTERHAGFAKVAESLSAKAGFRPGLSTDDALGILFALQSEESCLLLVGWHGWTGERWEEWVRGTLLAQFYPAAG